MRNDSLSFFKCLSLLVKNSSLEWPIYDCKLFIRVFYKVLEDKQESFYINLQRDAKIVKVEKVLKN